MTEIGGRSMRAQRKRLLVVAVGSLGLALSHSNSCSAGSQRETGEIEIYLDGAQGVASPIDKSQTAAEPLSPPEAATRLFCVRTCDGFYFPLDLPRDASSPADADSACRGACPGAEVLTYYQDGNSDSIERAKTFDLEDYGSLKHAYSYRTNLNAACGCRRPADLNESILTDPTLRQGDIVATSQGLVMFRGYENTNQLEKNFSSVRSAPVPRQFEAEIREIDRQYPDTSGPSVKIISDASKSPSDGIHFVDKAPNNPEEHF